MRLIHWPFIWLLISTLHCSFLLAKESEKKHGEHKRDSGVIKPDQSLDFLKKGNRRFFQAHLSNAGIGKKDREKLVSGQKPHAIILSCSDSRVPPEIVFDQKLGEIFVVRTAGQSLGASAIASIEYAVSHLGSNLIVVMGHESCGAVKAALETLKGGDAGSLWLNQLVKDLHPHLKRFSELSRTDGVLVESWANVEGVARDLIERSEIIRKLVESKEVRIQNALYHLGTGEVEWR
ncbi:MAG: carbonic anhydrase [Bacteriovorax sp.]|jgi:carbonic anhydrase|nr:carbonic anhydrase [Bacteriovorax sp.]